MNQILNLTQHFATPAQTQAGVHEPVFKSQVQNLITFDSIPTEMGMRSRAQKLAYMTKEDGYQDIRYLALILKKGENSKWN